MLTLAIRSSHDFETAGDGAGYPNRTDAATPWAERGVDGVVQRRRLPLDA